MTLQLLKIGSQASTARLALEILCDCQGISHHMRKCTSYYQRVFYIFTHIYFGATTSKEPDFHQD